MNSFPEPIPLPAADHGRSSTGRSRGRFRSWHAKAAAFRAALLVFALISALIGAVVYTLDRNAQRSSRQQAITELASGSRVAASTFSALRANLRANAGQIAASLDLQRAVIVGDQGALRRFALAHNTRIVVGGHTFGALAPPPRIASTAIIASNARILAHVTITLSLGNELLKLIRDETPLPAEAALVLAQNGRVIAGGPHRAAARVRDAGVVFGSIDFAAQAAPVGLPHTEVLAVEPMRAVQAGSLPYRRRLLLAALVTLVLAAGLATRLGRPVARLLNDVSRLTHQAQTDALTGLANRRSLDERLAQELDRAQRLGACVAFVIADIDNFKLVNDRYGHKTGDDVLRAVARVFKSVREFDLAARYGGEELALVLPGTRADGAERIVERIRRAVAEIVVEGPSGAPVSVTASFGVAAFPTFATVEALIEAADSALYEAKRSGKDRVVAQTGTASGTPGAGQKLGTPA